MLRDVASRRRRSDRITRPPRHTRRPVHFETLEPRMLLAGDLACYVQHVEGTRDPDGNLQLTYVQSQQFLSQCGYDPVEGVLERANPLRENVRQHFQQAMHWLQRVLDARQGGQFHPFHRDVARDALADHLCTDANDAQCRTLAEQAADNLLNAALSGQHPELNSIARLYQFLINEHAGQLRASQNAQLELLAESYEAFHRQLLGAEAIGSGSSLFPAGADTFWDTLQMPPPGGISPVEQLPQSETRIDGPDSRTTYLEDLGWTGNVRRGDFTGSGDGVEFSSTSGTLDINWDAGSNVSLITLHVEGVGTYAEPGVKCEGSGTFDNIDLGQFSIDNGAMRVNGLLGGASHGTCDIQQPDGSVTIEKGTISFNGSYQGTIDPSLRFASGTFEAGWQSTLGPNGVISGTWSTRVDPASFDKSVQIISDAEDFARSLAQSMALGAGESVALYRGGTFQLDVFNRGTDEKTIDSFHGFGLPVAGDWDGSGVTRVGSFDHGQWKLDLDGNAGPAERSVTFGAWPQQPVVGDWDGDGQDDLGVFDDGTWTLRHADGSETTVVFGDADSTPVVGDWDGDGIDELGTFKDGVWMLRSADGSVSTITFGGAGDLPAVGDWANRGSDSFAVFNDGQWQFDLDGAGGASERTIAFGQAGDIPLAGFWSNLYFDEHSFYSRNTPDRVPDHSSTLSKLTIAEDIEIGAVEVTVDIDHAFNDDLDVFLIAPDGTRVELFSDVGGDQDNFHKTVLSDVAATPITSGTAPFSGRFRPEGSLSDLQGRNAAGSWTLEVSDDDDLFSGTINSWSLDIQQGNSPPQMDAIADRSVEAGASLNLIVTATDPEAPPQQLTYSIEVGPGAATIDANSGEFNWTPSASDAGSHEITIRVVDNGSPRLTDTASFTVIVDAPPKLDPIPNFAVIAGQMLVFTATASEMPPSTTRYFSLDAGGTSLGATIDELTGQFSWTPDLSHAGASYQMEVTVTDVGSAARSDNDPFMVVVVSPDANPWQHPVNPMDVDADGVVTPTDVLLVINELNQHGPHSLPSPPTPPHLPPPMYDVNGDGRITAVDVLIIINHLNDPPMSSPEGEPALPLPGSRLMPLVAGPLGSERAEPALKPLDPPAGSIQQVDDALTRYYTSADSARETSGRAARFSRLTSDRDDSGLFDHELLGDLDLLARDIATQWRWEMGRRS